MTFVGQHIFSNVRFLQHCKYSPQVSGHPDQSVTNQSTTPHGFSASHSSSVSGLSWEHSSSSNTSIVSFDKFFWKHVTSLFRTPLPQSALQPPQGPVKNLKKRKIQGTSDIRGFEIRRFHKFAILKTFDFTLRMISFLIYVNFWTKYFLLYMIVAK